MFDINAFIYHIPSCTLQVAAKVKVKVYFDQDDDIIRFKPNFSRDFTVIDDGEIIGITETFGTTDNYSSRWFFNNHDQKEVLIPLKNSLIDHGITFEEFQDEFRDRLT